MPTYEIFENTRGQELIRRIDEDGSVWEFSKDPANSNYQRYLNPEAEQSTPSVIDETSTK